MTVPWTYPPFFISEVVSVRCTKRPSPAVRHPRKFEPCRPRRRVLMGEHDDLEPVIGHVIGHAL